MRYVNDRKRSTSTGARDGRSALWPFQSLWSNLLAVVLLATFFLPWSQIGTLGEVLSYVIPLSLAVSIGAIELARRSGRTLPPANLSD